LPIGKSLSEAQFNRLLSSMFDVKDAKSLVLKLCIMQSDPALVVRVLHDLLNYRSTKETKRLGLKSPEQRALLAEALKSAITKVEQLDQFSENPRLFAMVHDLMIAGQGEDVVRAIRDSLKSKL
jgi:hypothetical protein